MGNENTKVEFQPEWTSIKNTKLENLQGFNSDSELIFKNHLAKTCKKWKSETECSFQNVLIYDPRATNVINELFDQIILTATIRDHSEVIKVNKT